MKERHNAMHKRFQISFKARERLQTALGLVLIALFGYGLVWLIMNILALDREVSVAILAGMITVLGSTFSIIMSRQYEKQREMEREIREKKIPIYTGFIEYLLKGVLAPQHIRQFDTESDDMVKRLQDFNVKVLIWGSDDVLREWIKFRNALLLHTARSKGDNSTDMQRDFNTLVNAILPTGDFLLAMRKDIGHNNRKLSGYLVMRLFINDIDDIMMRALKAATPKEQQEQERNANQSATESNV